MTPQEPLPGLFTFVNRKTVNLFLIVDEESVTIVDTGFPGSGDEVLGAVAACGRGPDDVADILVTHCHSDHAGSLAELKARTAAASYMHPTDAEFVRQGKTMRPVSPAPTPMSHVFYRMHLKGKSPDEFDIPPAEVDHEILDGEDIAVAGGMTAIHVPGHCAGQLAFLWHRHGGVLFAADAAANAFGLRLSPVYENLDDGRRSLAKLSGLEFEHACFGHGKPILGGAAKMFRKKWPPVPQGASESNVRRLDSPTGRTPSK